MSTSRASATGRTYTRPVRLGFARTLRRHGRRAFRALARAPFAVRVLAGALALVLAWSLANWIYQVVRKPAEMLFPVSGVLAKSPAETWRQYGPLFRRHATAVITPEMLAALAQVEGAGNPAARTYWEWRLSWNPFEVYRPASSAVGMYQITDAAFRDARRYCIRDHAVVEDGPWYDLRSCWFNGLYTRVLPSHAVEMTAALLDRAVARTLARRRVVTATFAQKQDLAAVVHLCGPAAGDAFARRGFQPTPGQRCGGHDLRGYLAQLSAMKRQFARLAAAA
jgi:Transglycosylase SLT domain